MLARCNQDDPQLAGGSPQARHSNALYLALVQSFLESSEHRRVAGSRSPCGGSNSEFSAAVSPEALGPDLMSFGPRFEAEFEAEHALTAGRAKLAAAAEVRCCPTRLHRTGGQEPVTSAAAAEA
jgi:hypothetical protein